MSFFTRTPSGLQFHDHVVGAGPVPLKGAQVIVHYTGWLTDGRKFDSSRDRNEPFSFRLGAGEVIAAWDEGVASMRIGGRREVIVPPELGYGAAGLDDLIPPNAWLRFDIELLAAG